MSWQDVSRSSLCSVVKGCGTKPAHNILILKSSSRIRRNTVLGMFKDSAIIFYAIRQLFLTKSATATMFTHFESILDGHLSRHLLLVLFSLEIENTTQKHFISSEPHSHKTFALILVFLSQIDRLWNKIIWQLSVHFCHSWRKETDFTRQVITRTLSRICKRNSKCERMLVNST
jgi:hypothetical protein